MDLHMWRIPQWPTEAQTHDILVELIAKLIHSDLFADITGGLSLNFHVKLLPKSETDSWRKATVAVPYEAIGQRILDYYGHTSLRRIDLPHDILVQQHTGVPQHALWERLRVTTYVPPEAKHSDGPDGVAIPISRIAFGRLVSLDADRARWSVEWSRPKELDSYAIFDSVFERLRLESRFQPAIVVEIRNVRSAIIDVDDDRALVLFHLGRPPPFLLAGNGSPTDAPYHPGDLAYGHVDLHGALLTRRSELDLNHADVAPYIGTEVLVQVARADWTRFEASSAEIGLPEPFRRELVLEELHLYGAQILNDMNGIIAMSAFAGIAVQLDALARNGAVVPANIIRLAGCARQALRSGKLVDHVVSTLIELGNRLLPRFSLYDGDTIHLNGVDWRIEWDRAIALERHVPIDDDTTVSTYRVFVTPSSMRIDGPFIGVANRILRTYGHVDHFVRVAFVGACPCVRLFEPSDSRTDEDESPFAPSHDVDIEAFIEARCGPILRDGLAIGGRHFELLAFSMSSLREHAVWFVAPFFHLGNMVTASTIRDEIGDLSALLRKPARYAARLSQTLTGTECAVLVEPSWLRTEPDMASSTGEDFTDGVGLMSPLVAAKIHDQLPYLHPHRSQDRAPLASVQLRIGGAKGMLSVDASLVGHQIVLRPSMRKFKAPEDRIEVAQTFREPMAYNLNRPLIQMLEGLGVSKHAFLAMQREALGLVRKAGENARDASRFMSSYSFGDAYHLAKLFHHLARTLHLSQAAHRYDPFLSRVLDLAMHIAKRELKYRARIVVPGSWTLVGVADVHGVLREGEIYACVVEPHVGTKTWLEGRIAVSRSPTEHPGDIQMARAVGRMPVQHRHLYDPLTNVVVFPSCGARPMPAMLAGGDLDGDIFNLLLDPRLQPPTTVAPSPPGLDVALPMRQIDHDCETEDIADWVVDFMQHDNLGVISALRLHLADFSRQGPLDPECLRLSDLASAAVDYRKTGARVPHSWLPKPPPQKPDFMRPEGGPPQAQAYYQSRKALGHLYRAITLPPPPDEVDVTTIELGDALAEEIETLCAALGLVAAPASATTTTTPPALLSAYATALRRLCAAQTPALTEAEAVVGRALAPLPAKDPRRRAASAREVEAATGALTTWARRQVGDAETALAIWRYARAEGRRWGARSLAVLCVGMVLDKVAELQSIGKGGNALRAML